MTIRSRWSSVRVGVGGAHQVFGGAAVGTTVRLALSVRAREQYGAAVVGGEKRSGVRYGARRVLPRRPRSTRRRPLRSSSSERQRWDETPCAVELGLHPLVEQSSLQLPLVELVRQRASVETTTSPLQKTLEILLHRCRKCPHSRAGSVGGRCQNSLYDNGIRRHRGAPGRVRRSPPDPHRARPPRRARAVVPHRTPRLADTLTALAALRHQITELELRHAHHADRLDLGAEAGAADTGSLLGQHHPADQAGRETTPGARARPGPRPRAGPGRDGRRPGVRGAGGGDRQGCRRAAGRAPPRRRGAPDRLAAEHDPVALRRLAHQVLEVVAPEIAEEHELKALQRQEALAEEACRFTIADDGHGLCHGRFTLPSPVGAMLKQAVLAINSPRAPAATPAPPKGSGTRSASTSPATRSTGSPRPAAWTPPWWSP